MESPLSRDSAANRRPGEDLSAEALDPVIEVFKRDIDFTLVERNLRLTVDERARQLANATKFIARFRPLVSGKASSTS
jgi:hypothetical protein